jgi:hypothetical protein
MENDEGIRRRHAGEHSVHQGATRRYGSQGINAVAFHPGNANTNFASDTKSPIRFFYHTPLGRLILVSPEKGAKPLVWLAEGTPGIDWQPGEYYEKTKLAKRNNPQASDAELARQIWDRSTEMAGV